MSQTASHRTNTLAIEAQARDFRTLSRFHRAADWLATAWNMSGGRDAVRVFPPQTFKAGIVDRLLSFPREKSDAPVLGFLPFIAAEQAARRFERPAGAASLRNLPAAGRQRGHR